MLALAWEIQVFFLLNYHSKGYKVTFCAWIFLQVVHWLMKPIQKIKSLLVLLAGEYRVEKVSFRYHFMRNSDVFDHWICLNWWNLFFLLHRISRCIHTSLLPSWLDQKPNRWTKPRFVGIIFRWDPQWNNQAFQFNSL